MNPHPQPATANPPDQMKVRTIYILAGLFFLCAGVLFFLGLQTDGSLGETSHLAAQSSIWQNLLTALLAVAGCLLGLIIYFLPALVARDRRHRERTPIFLVNLFFGWTFVGWVAALVWSFTSQVEADPTSPQRP